MKTIKTFALAALLSATAFAGAQAHVSFLDREVPLDTTILATLQVPHGCDGKATTEVRVKLPEGFVFAKPQPKAGWELEVIKGDYQKTYDNHGDKVKAGAIEIRWKDGNLSDDFYDTFVIQGKVSGVEAGSSLAFPVTQLCGDAVTAWDQVATAGGDAHELKSPAPLLKVVAGEDHGHDHDDMAGMSMPGMDTTGKAGMDTTGKAGMDMSAMAAGAQAGETVKAGDLEISGAFAKAMLPGQPVGGGFFTVKNNGKTDDRLVSVSSPVAGEVQIHEMATKDNVMRMRQLKDGVAIAAGETLKLEPGNLHLMFQKVKTPFKQGDTVPVTLSFEKAGKIDLVLQVLSAQGK
ncbi:MULTISPECIES: copper chaperone PCu(A)C [Rhizobium]|uniref:copper chaperone PCu(A)C n=1 Tax=Rhizobium TaxID=379 RepID=UPI0007E968B7|nr:MULTISPECIES: copper chaperone PCu(A)C [Rhizobium]ANK91796.1 GLE1 domain-containing protein [Rhizobium sp. N6212]ANK97830.1 GLE1 domain-containing protein [Rhizobium sp. N621]ANL03909.1 GLE1 domain-containing protein [Rhizobium esperanzae]ANL09955.1 GLE1 domain-containing protein [Rhizobium sp. N1341]ANL22007.1 GLE1 domain-containing protein [Rhizobium sp. N113]